MQSNLCNICLRQSLEKRSLMKFCVPVLEIKIVETLSIVNVLLNIFQYFNIGWIIHRFRGWEKHIYSHIFLRKFFFVEHLEQKKKLNKKSSTFNHPGSYNAASHLDVCALIKSVF